MDVAAWLGDLGLSEYAPAFRENAIDADVRSDLEGCFAADQAALRAMSERHPDVFPMPFGAEWIS